MSFLQEITKQPWVPGGACRSTGCKLPCALPLIVENSQQEGLGLEYTSAMRSRTDSARKNRCIIAK